MKREFFFTLDIGNSQKEKCLFWENFGDSFSSIDIKELPAQIKKLSCSPSTPVILISDVACQFNAKNYPELFELAGQNKVSLIFAQDFFKAGFFLEMPSRYHQSLGIDRLLACYHVYRQHHLADKAQSTSLVIDAGSYITLDAVDKSGHQGGYIFPGPSAWAMAYLKGAQLKERQQEVVDQAREALQDTDFCPTSWPHSSAQAMGQTQIIALLGTISQLLKTHSIERIILSGGDGKSYMNLVQKHLADEKCAAPTSYDAHLNHQAMKLLAQEVEF